MKRASSNCSIDWNAINNACAFAQLEDFPRRQRPVYLGYWYMNEVESGGHERYFCERREFDHDEVIKSLKTVGAEEHGVILKNALNALRGGKTTESQPQEIDWTQFDEAFDSCKTTIASHLLVFVNSRQPEFATWTRRRIFRPKMMWAMCACVLIPAFVAYFAARENFPEQPMHDFRFSLIGAFLGLCGFGAFQAREILLNSIANCELQNKPDKMLIGAKWILYIVVFPSLLLAMLLFAASFI